MMTIPLDFNLFGGQRIDGYMCFPDYRNHWLGSRLDAKFVKDDNRYPQSTPGPWSCLCLRRPAVQKKYGYFVFRQMTV